MKTKQQSGTTEHEQALIIPFNPVIKSESTNQQIDESIYELLNVKTLRLCKGYENLSDAQATEIVNSLKTFASILVNTHLKNSIVIDNQQVVYLKQQNKAS